MELFMEGNPTPPRAQEEKYYEGKEIENTNDFFETMVEIEHFFGTQEELVVILEKISQNTKDDIFEMFRNADSHFDLLKTIKNVSFQKEDQETMKQ